MSPTSDIEIRIERLFDAPPPLLGEVRDMVLASGMEHGATIYYDRMVKRAMLMSA